MTLAKLLGIAALVVIGGIHWALSYAGPRALGWIVPVIYVGLIIGFANRGDMASWLDWIMAAVGLAVLIGLWANAKQQKTKAEMNRIDNTLTPRA